MSRHCSGSKGGGGYIKGAVFWAVANVNFVIVPTLPSGAAIQSLIKLKLQPAAVHKNGNHLVRIKTKI